jgi:hypothetical protein
MRAHEISQADTQLLTTAVMVSHPGAVTRLILQAANATVK